MVPDPTTNTYLNQRLLLPKPPKLNPRIRRPPPNSDLLLVVDRQRCLATGFLWILRLLPKPPPEALRLAERNLVLFMLLSDFFDVERNLFDETPFPPAVLAAEAAGAAFFILDVDDTLRFCTELTVLGPPYP